jgi:hypothetical protein
MRWAPPYGVVVAGLLALSLGHATQARAASTSSRSFACGGYAPGQPMQVTVQVNPDASVQAWATEDSPPSGWTVTSISNSGVFDSVNGKVKWGPLFDGVARTLSYSATPPAGTSGTEPFTGKSSFDGVNVTTTGSTSLGLDATPPSITCPAAPAPIAANASCQAAVPDLVSGAIASDNCGGAVTITQSPSAGTLVELGSTTVTLTAQDVAGNAADCPVEIVVIDTTPPSITCPATPAPIAATANCQAAVPNLVNGTTATDNCAGAVTITQIPTAGTLVGLGNRLVTLVAKDAANNTRTCTVTITVVDTTPPTISCPTTPAPIPVGPTGCQAAVPNLVSGATASDNCGAGGVTITQNPTAGTLVGLGNTSVTLTAKDAANNTATCTVTVTVTNTAPVIDQGNGPLALAVSVNSTCPTTSQNKLTLSATDAQGTTGLNWSVKTAPTAGTVSFVGGQTGAGVVVCYQPDTESMTSDGFAIRVTDGCGAADEIPIDVTVNAIVHPADTSPDWIMLINEVTAYAACWRTGCTWSHEPNPVPIEYVTRAGYLWRAGEVYHYNTSHTCPDCWQTGVSASGAAPSVRRNVTTARTADAEATAIDGAQGQRSIVPDPAVAGRFIVTLQITPAADASAWAVEESVPSGWQVSDVTESGTFDAAARKIKWGLFLDAQPRALSCAVTAPAEGGTIILTGVTSVDGGSKPITGDNSIEAGQNQPVAPVLPGCGAGLLGVLPCVFVAMMLVMRSRAHHA